MTHSRTFAAAMLLAGVAALAAAQTPASKDTTPAMKQVPLKTAIGEGKDQQVDMLFDGPRRKLMQITLRNRALLARHSVPVPITIQCVAGGGTLTAGEDRQSIALTPGTLVTIEPNVVHEIQASPSVSILLTRFTGN